MTVKKLDNSTEARKIRLRRSALREVERPSIVETHGGDGVLYRACYATHQRGVVFETEERRADLLSEQRPGWAVYHTDCAEALAAGVGFQFNPNFFDLDPYGQCWPAIDGIFAGLKVKPPRLVFVVNDGLRQKVRVQESWTMGTLEEMVLKYGNDRLHKMYLQICQELLDEKARAAGYAVKRWTGYYCGDKHDMTHFAAVLDLVGK